MGAPGLRKKSEILGHALIIAPPPSGPLAGRFVFLPFQRKTNAAAGACGQGGNRLDAR